MNDEEAIASARTELAPIGSMSPPTEPRFAGDASDAARALIKQIDRISRKYLDAISALGQGPEMMAIQQEIDAARGVCRVLERCIGPRTHYLKTDPEPFAEVKSGRKRYEVRKFDRDFRIGDRLVLTEFDRDTRLYSGDKFVVVVTYITQPGAYGMPEDIGVLGIEPIAEVIAA